MCRWVAYAGPRIFLEDILFKQENSLVRQSVHAQRAAQTTNGDGFGVAWYGSRETPGLFRDILPAWNDENLRSVAGQIEAKLFFAHVRASTGTSVSRANCHPFVFRNWAFMHNGRIGDWGDLRRDIEHLIDPALFTHRLGTTDSEAIFLLALTCGLADDPVAGMREALRKILDLQIGARSNDPTRISAAVTDGTRIWAFRFSSDRQSPSLVFGHPRPNGNSALPSTSTRFRRSRSTATPRIGTPSTKPKASCGTAAASNGFRSRSIDRRPATT